VQGGGMTDGQILVATWDRICVAIDCQDKRTARKKLKALGVKVKKINGVAHVDILEIREKMK
jgi:hypothetical protein